MSKPRIFIHMHYMELGGAERALLGLLGTLDPERVDVDLFLNQHTGALLPLIPKHVNLLPERRGYNAIERPMRAIIKERQWTIALARLRAKMWHKQYLRRHDISDDGMATHVTMDFVSPHLPSLHDFGEYDLAISFLDPPHIVQDKVLAKKRIEWIHTDFTAFHYDAEATLPRWAANDYIASISPDISRSFVSKFPSLSDKIIEIENIISPAFVRQQAGLHAAPEMVGCQGVKLLTVGRICHAKNYDNLPFIIDELKRSGLNFKWFVVGPGNHAEIDKLAARLGVADCMVFLGARRNPYPYIKTCDIYVQPSRYEGKSITVREAQILCKPVIITRYATSGSQMQDGVDGIICDMDNNSVARAIVALATDKPLQQRLSDYLAAHDYGNESEVNKIYKLIDV